jgi:hypothetical protein
MRFIFIFLLPILLISCSFGGSIDESQTSPTPTEVVETKEPNSPKLTSGEVDIGNQTIIMVT